MFRSQTPEYRAQYRRKRLAKCRRQNREWYHRNRRMVLAQKRAKYRTDPRQDMLGKARARARKLGCRFNLTVDDIPPMPMYCPALGLRLTVGSNRMRETSPTLDRILPKRGYVRGNVAIISNKANRIKNNATSAAELQRVATWFASVTTTETK